MIAGSKRKLKESKEEADARRETDKYRASKRRSIATEEEKAESNAKRLVR
jgi:hypothetical protein